MKIIDNTFVSNTPKITAPLLTKALLVSLPLLTMTYSVSSLAHFQELIPDRDFTNNDNQQAISLDIQFTHPMSQGPMMNMAKPNKFKVRHNKTDIDLLPFLKEIHTDSANKNQNISKWASEYTLTTPGDHIFYIEPKPYWEPEENKMIIHYTKVIVNGYDELQGWDTLIGLPVEIEPLTRPYSLWTGNSFQGIVRKNGIAVPFAEIEVEWRNDGSIKEVPESYVTQVIKADINGTFSYVMPRSGWWGFAALIDADYQLTSPDKNNVDVELGGLIWVNAKDMTQEKK